MDLNPFKDIKKSKELDIDLSPEQIEKAKEQIEKEISDKALERWRNYTGKFRVIVFEGNTFRIDKMKAQQGFLLKDFGDQKFVILSDPIPQKCFRGYNMVFFVDNDKGLTFTPTKVERGMFPPTLGAIVDDRLIRAVFKLDVDKKKMLAGMFFTLVIGFIGGLIL